MKTCEKVVAAEARAEAAEKKLAETEQAHEDLAAFVASETFERQQAEKAASNVPRLEAIVKDREAAVRGMVARVAKHEADAGRWAQRAATLESENARLFAFVLYTTLIYYPYACSKSFSACTKHYDRAARFICQQSQRTLLSRSGRACRETRACTVCVACAIFCTA